MEFPLFDYAPSTLLGIAVLAVLFGWLVPYRVVKQLLARVAFLESTVEKLQTALDEERQTSKVVRNFFEGLSRGAE